MIYLAFKNGAESLKAEPALSILHQMIMQRTGGKFVHVELWIEGAQDRAVCYSSRNGGTSWALVDLSNTALWTIIPMVEDAEIEKRIRWYTLGACGKPYDSLGILGIGWNAPNVHNEADRFCSEACLEALQMAGGLFFGVAPRWMVAPSGSPAGGYGLYELALPISKALLSKQPHA